MKKRFLTLLPGIAIAIFAISAAAASGAGEGFTLGWKETKSARAGSLEVSGLYYESDKGRMEIPVWMGEIKGRTKREIKMADGWLIIVSVKPDGRDYIVSLSTEPESGVTKWGLHLKAEDGEYFTGLMERVVDGPQAASWARGIEAATNLRGQKVDMILKPTLSVYAPYFISSRGYGVFVKGNWPGVFDFCKEDAQQVRIEFEGPSFEMKVYAGKSPAELVQEHALDAGPPVLPPKWMYSPWRWRDEHTQRATYYDGTPVTGPFNSEVMEDVLLMKAYGIPCGVYWIDRPWGPGGWGYDDFKIDEKRLPHFPEMVKWLNGEKQQMLLWIAPFFQGEMASNAFAKGYTLAGQKRPANGNNYPMVDLTNPEAKKYWQDGVAKLLKMGVAAFKLDRAEEDIPESGPYMVFDKRTIRENRNAYPPMYVKAVYDVARKHRGSDFVAMPRAAYTGSAAYGVFWGGDIGGTQEGLRASIIGVQRAAVMGYPNWGSDTCGYNNQLMETEVCARWLAFSCFTPIMEVGPTHNMAFWNFHTPPRYDADLIAVWRLYARLHERLADYSYVAAVEAKRSGMPIVRPLFLVESGATAAWSNWWTYQYGPDILVSAIWEKNKKSVEVYLPSGAKWRDAWNAEKVYDGGRTITVNAEMHEMPIFVRVGAKLKLGDLKKEWAESVEAANKKPDLKALDADLKAWFDKKYPKK